MQALAEREALEIMDEEEELAPEERLLLRNIRRRKKIVVLRHQREKDVRSNYPSVPRMHNMDGTLSLSNMQVSLERLGMDPSKAIDTIRSESRGRSKTRKKRSAEEMEVISKLCAVDCAQIYSFHVMQHHNYLLR